MSEVSQGRGDPAKPVPEVDKKGDQPGHQDRPMTEDETLDESLDDTFPASDPVPPSRIDGPNN